MSKVNHCDPIVPVRGAMSMLRGKTGFLDRSRGTRGRGKLGARVTDMKMEGVSHGCCRIGREA